MTSSIFKSLKVATPFIAATLSVPANVAVPADGSVPMLTLIVSFAEVRRLFDESLISTVIAGFIGEFASVFEGSWVMTN